MKLAPDEIIVGDRVRKDVETGIRELGQSISELGQLQPVLIDPDYNLIAGARRVRACELLGREVWCEIVVTLDDLTKRLKAERDENTCRQPFKPSELVAMGQKLEAVEKPKAEERKKATQLAGKDEKGKPVIGEEKFSPPNDRGKTTDKVAAALGVSRPTYEKAKAVVAAAAEPDAPPEVVEAKEEMDRTGKVDPAHKIVKRWSQGDSQLADVKPDTKVDQESNNLFELKRIWARSSKKDRKAFLSFTKENQ